MLEGGYGFRRDAQPRCDLQVVVPLREQLEHTRLARRELLGLAPAGFIIEAGVADGIGKGDVALVHHVECCRQQVERMRLAHIGARAGPARQWRIALGVSARQHHDPRRLLDGTHAPYHFQPIQSRQVDIDHGERGTQLP